MLSRKKREDIASIVAKKGYNVVKGSIYDMMSIWLSWYRGDVNDFHRYNLKTINGTTTQKSRTTLSMAKKVCEDWNSLMVNEKLTISIDNDKLQDKLDMILKENNFEIEFSDIVEKAFALGTTCMVEFTNDNKVNIDYITGDLILPISYSNNEITGIITINEFMQGEKVITHLTYHEVIEGKYEVRHEVYKSTSGDVLGNESDLTYVFTDAEIAELETPVFNEDGELVRIEYKIVYDTDQPMFQIIKPNLSNNFDLYSPMGISVFANSIDTLKSLDSKYDALLNEVDLGKKRIFVNSEATKEQMSSSPQTGDTTWVRYFDANETVYLSMPLLDDEPLKFYEPALNTQALSDVVNHDLSMYGFKCGLGTSYYAFNDGQVYQNEASVISTNSDVWKNKKKHELILEKALESMTRAVLYLDGVREEYEVTIEFDDSIIVDDEAILNNMKEDAMNGNIPMWRYIAKRYKLDEKEAKEWVEEAEVKRANMFNIGLEDEDTLDDETVEEEEVE